LTQGEFGVVDLAVAEGSDEREALALAAGVERDSEHSLARGIRAAAEARGIEPAAISGFEALKGRGVRAESDGRPVHVGGPRIIEELGAELPANLRRLTEAAGASGRTVIYLLVDERPVAAFALADVVRPESRAAIDRLHAMGVGIAMLTGDSDEVARAVAAELGIDRFFARVLPEDKDKRVSQLQAEGATVAMVGDGVNDAPALARADVGIAIGSGTDVAIASAGIVLVRSDPRAVASVVELSRASYRKMLQNLWWASGYNVVALPLAAGLLAPWGVLLSPAVGALFMSASTILVALNAQLLRRHQL
jgi:Cu2+-exporting ATPase